MIKWGNELKKAIPSGYTKWDLFFITNGKVKYIDIYEPHGFFKSKDQWIVYGHENIITFDKKGNVITNQTIR